MNKDEGLRSLGLKIQMIRKKKSITQEDFAKQLHISRTYVGYIEQGRQYPSLKLLMKIAKQLEVGLPTLLTTDQF